MSLGTVRLRNVAGERFAWERFAGDFSLGAWELSLGSFQLGMVNWNFEFGNVHLSHCEISLGNFSFEPLAWELCLEPLDWDLWLRSWAFETGGSCRGRSPGKPREQVRPGSLNPFFKKTNRKLVNKPREGMKLGHFAWKHCQALLPGLVNYYFGRAGGTQKETNEHRFILPQIGENYWGCPAWCHPDIRQTTFSNKADLLVCGVHIGWFLPFVFGFVCFSVVAVFLVSYFLTPETYHLRGVPICSGVDKKYWQALEKVLDSQEI